MAVYDIAAGQRPAQPVTAHYEGKALRAGIRSQELQNEALEQDIELAPEYLDLEKRRTEVVENRNAIDMNALQFEIGKQGVTALHDAFASGLAMFEETGDPQQAYEVAANKLAAADPTLDDEEARAMLDEETGGQFDPRAIKSFLMSSEKHLEIQAANEKLTEAQKLVEGLDLPPEEKQRLLKAIADKKGTIVGRTPEDVASYAGAGDAATDRKTSEIVVSAENMVQSIERISDQVDKMPQSAMGLPGTVAKVIDNTATAVMGFGEMFGGTAQVGENEVADSLLLDAKLYQDMFSGPAAQSAALQANQIGLGYALARSANPDGRISDADVRHQMERVRLGGSSKTQIQAAIHEVKREVLVNTANHLRINQYTREPEGKAAYDKIMAKVEEMDSQSAAPTGEGLKVGQVEDGYEYLGGDPGDPENWRKK